MTCLEPPPFSLLLSLLPVLLLLVIVVQCVIGFRLWWWVFVVVVCCSVVVVHVVMPVVITVVVTVIFVASVVCTIRWLVNKKYKPKKNQSKPANLSHGCGFGVGVNLLTCTHTHMTCTHEPMRVCIPVIITRLNSLGNSLMAVHYFLVSGVAACGVSVLRWGTTKTQVPQASTCVTN